MHRYLLAISLLSTFHHYAIAYTVCFNPAINEHASFSGVPYYVSKSDDCAPRPSGEGLISRYYLTKNHNNECIYKSPNVLSAKDQLECKTHLSADRAMELIDNSGLKKRHKDLSEFYDKELVAGFWGENKEDLILSNQAIPGQDSSNKLNTDPGFNSIMLEGESTDRGFTIDIGATK